MTATSGQLPAQARADLDRLVNDIRRDADLRSDGTAAHIRQTDAQSDYLYGNAERLIKALPGTGWRGTFSAVRLIDDGDRAELMFDCEYRAEWKD